MNVVPILGHGFNLYVPILLPVVVFVPTNPPHAARHAHTELGVGRADFLYTVQSILPSGIFAAYKTLPVFREHQR